MVKNPPANAEDLGSIPGLGRSTGGAHGNPLQYSCLENPMHWGAWQATVHGVAESDMTEWLTLSARDWITPWMMGFEVPSWPVLHLSSLGRARGGGHLVEPHLQCRQNIPALGAIFTWAGSEETLGHALHRDMCVSLHTCARTTAHKSSEHAVKAAVPGS